MTKEEKILALKKLLWLNFRDNFMKGETKGLCVMYSNMGYCNPLRKDIPELVPPLEREDDIYWFWWETHGRIIPWWKRHKAIYKTINKLKRS